METLVQDLRYALRGLRKSPTFSAVAVITLALGIGANTAMFSIIDGVVLRPLPYRDSDNLVQIYETDGSRGEHKGPVSPYNFADWQKQASVFEKMAAYGFDSFSYRAGAVAERMFGVMVTPEFLRVLGIAPALGRDFEPDEDAPGKPHTAILSYGAWQRRFGGDRDVVGRTMMINGEPYTIVGVMPSGFTGFPNPSTEIWALPAYVLANVSRGHHGLFAFGRLRPGVSLEQAQSQMDTIARRLAKDYPNTNASSGIRLVQLRDEIVGPAQSMMVLLGVAVVIVLVITCANLGSLLLGRVMSREREIAIRMALGASRTRLAGQVLTESILLAAIGGAIGVAVAYWAVPALIAAFGRFIPRAEGIGVNAPVLLFSALATMLCGIAFGVAPAFAGSSLELYNASSQRVSTATTVRTGRFSLRRTLVVLEVGLALALMIAAGVLFKSMWLLNRVNPGFDPNGVLTFRVQAPSAQYPTDIQRVQLSQKLVDRLAALPGVQSVAAVNDLPFSGSRSSSSFSIERLTYNGPGMAADRRTASENYFRTMGIPLLRGREFTAADTREARLVAIVNEALVRKYLANRNPLEQELFLHDKDYWIVGVVGDVKHDDLTAADSPEVYTPLAQGDSAPWTFVAVKSRLSAAVLSDEVRRAAAEVAPDQPIYSVQTMNERLANWFAPRRFSTTILGLFTGLALILAAVGIYGVISYFVTQRTHEFGIRMALGASAGNVLRLVLRQAATIVAVAILGGLLVSLAINRLLSSMLFGVTAVDPTASSIAVLMLALVALLASYLPARRATTVDPVEALRYE
jgi:putative ABC transport system permease protein